MASLTELGGRLQLDFADGEVAILRDLLSRVGDLLADADAETDTVRRTPSDPVLARLLPDAHRDDPDVAAAHRELTEATVRQDKRADSDAVLADLPRDAGSAVLSDPDAWLRALNDVRLMLGVELGVTEQTEFPRRVGSQRDLQLTVYFWLTHLQDCLVEAVR